MFQLENSPLAIIELDNEHRVISWSVQAVNIFGWDAKLATGTLLEDLGLVSEQDKEAFYDSLNDLAGIVTGKQIGRAHV